jgi:hypothetical protein
MRTLQPDSESATVGGEPMVDTDNFWAPSTPPTATDVDDRPTLRPTGEFEPFEAREYPASGVHRIVPRDAVDVEGIEGALLKLLAG